MKKLLLILFCLITSLVIPLSAFSKDFLPRYVETANLSGVGVYFAPRDIVIYAEPDENDRKIAAISWNELDVQALPEDLSSKQAFITFLPKKDIVLLKVVNDTDNWYQVIYNQETEAKGWVKKTEPDQFMTWREFMTKYGTEKGLYFFGDMPAEYKKVHTGPSDDSKVLEGNYYWPDQVGLKFIKGNWMLVKIIDYNRTSSAIGWVRWRDDEGKIFVFPNLDQ